MAESRDYETTTMLEKIPWMGPTLDESAPHGHKRFAHVVTIISVEQKYDGNRESFLEAYSGPTSVDTAYGDSPGDWWHSKTYNKLGYEIIDEHRQVLKDELILVLCQRSPTEIIKQYLNRIHIKAISPELGN